MFLIVAVNAVLAIAVVATIVGLLAHSIRASHNAARTASGQLVGLGRSSHDRAQDDYRQAA
jgi:hypothetical protein